MAPTRWPLWCARHLTSTRRRTPPKRLATARGSAPPSPAARAHTSHLRSDGRRACERQPGTRPGGTCANRAEVCAPGAAHRAAAGGGHAARSSALGAPSSAVGRRACGRPRRRALWHTAVLPHWSRRRRSPARWSAHARAATACKWPRSRSVVRTPGPRGERAMGAALTRPTGIASASARARACGV